MYKLTAFNEEQSWIEAFNEETKSNVKMNQTFDGKDYFKIRQKITWFNNAIAFGPALKLEKIKE